MPTTLTDENRGVYQQLAQQLDGLPNGFPPAPDGAELRLLAYLFTPEEASLAAQLRPELETPDQLAQRLGGESGALRKQLKGMSRKGLIKAGAAQSGPTKGGLGFGLLPFVVGIYEMQVQTLNEEMARLFEDYFQQAFSQILKVQPALHRVIPIQESVKAELAVRPFESVTAIIANTQAWGVMDCICRKQRNLIGQGCHHPLETCMVLSNTPGAFDHAGDIRVLTQDEALATLHFAAEAGLVHCVGNSQSDLWYICNCCTCSCGLLRGMAELGLASVVAHSGFVLEIDAERCILCGACVERCQFSALALEELLVLDELRCAGCGVCTLVCTEEALHLAERSQDDMPLPPETEAEWGKVRAEARRMDPSRA